MSASRTKTSLLSLAIAAALAAQLSAQAPSQLLLRYGRFDPTQSTPAVPELLRSTNEGGLWIVQFDRIPTQADRDAIAAVGAERIGYLPQDAYVVRTGGGAVEALRRLPSVRWVGNYEVAYRVDPALLELTTLVAAFHATYQDAHMVQNHPIDIQCLGHVLDALTNQRDRIGTETVIENACPVLEKVIEPC